MMCFATLFLLLVTALAKREIANSDDGKQERSAEEVPGAKAGFQVQPPRNTSSKSQIEQIPDMLMDSESHTVLRKPNAAQHQILSAEVAHQGDNRKQFSTAYPSHPVPTSAQEISANSAETMAGVSWLIVHTYLRIWVVGVLGTIGIVWVQRKLAAKNDGEGMEWPFLMPALLFALLVLCALLLLLPSTDAVGSQLLIPPGIIKECRMVTPENHVVLAKDIVYATPRVVIQEHPARTLEDVGPNEQQVWRVLMFHLPDGSCREGGSYVVKCRPETTTEYIARKLVPTNSSDPCHASGRNYSEYCFYDPTRRCFPTQHHDPPLFIEGPIMGVLPVKRGPWRVAHLGLGEGSLDMWLVGHFPEVILDAVDISPDNINAARSALGMSTMESERFRVHLADANAWLRSQPKEPLFDALHLGVVDMFDMAHLYTVEYFKEIRMRLRPGGRMSIMANIVPHTSESEMTDTLQRAGFEAVAQGDGPYGTTIVGMTSRQTLAYYGLGGPGISRVPKELHVTQYFPQWKWSQQLLRTAGPSASDLNKIRIRFEDKKVFPQNRASVQKTHDYDGAQSSEKTKDPARTLPYLQTKCLRQRYEHAATQFAKFGCPRVLEVGGFLTPLVQAEHFKKGDVYVNVDPSLAAAKVEQEGSFSEIHLPVTLEEFVKSRSDLPGIREQFPCVLMLGMWKNHLETAGAKAAFKSVADQAEFVILESPESEGHIGLTMGAPILESLGYHETGHRIFDCSNDEEAKKLSSWSMGNLQRNMKLFQRGPQWKWSQQLLRTAGPSASASELKLD